MGKLAEDPRTPEELIRTALADPGSEESWRAIMVFHVRGSEQELELAQSLCESEQANERELGVHILGQLGCEKVAFLEPSMALLLARLQDSSDDVIAAAGVALGHRQDSRAIPYLAKLSSHPNPAVRLGVVRGLSGHSDQPAIQVLIKLSGDRDRDVREWATFGLGSQIDLNTQQIRDTLWSRVSDEDSAVRGEALIGLAERQDRRVLEPLRRELLGEFQGSWCLEAAEILADPGLLPFLQDLYDHLSRTEKAQYEDCFASALYACRPKEGEQPKNI